MSTGFGIVALAFVLLGGASADAVAEEVDPLDESVRGDGSDVATITIDDVGEGSCSPTITLPGRAVDCRFPLLGGATTVDRFDLPIVADLDVFFDDEAPATCDVDGDEIVCEDVQAFFRLGRAEVSVRIGFGESRELASFEIVDPFPYGFDAFLVGAAEPVAMEGRPVVVSAFATSDRDDITAWVQVRRRSSGAVVDVHELETGLSRDEWPDTLIDAPPVAGRYLLTFCVGPAADDCDPVPGRFGFQVIEPTLIELVEGHNRDNAERVNLVFAGSGFDSPDDLAELATGLLALDGPVPIDIDGNRVHGLIDEIDPSDVFDLAWGPFAIEPLRSSLDRFNFWYLETDIVDERAFFHNAHPQFSRDDELAGFALDHVSVVTVDLQNAGRFGRSEANWTSFRLREDLPSLSEIEFAGVYLAVDGFWPYGAATTLAHELGHALFDLRDEYDEPDRRVQYGYPNCASGLEQADRWWGERVGEVDPFVDTYIARQTQFGLHVPDDLPRQLAVGFEIGGCYGGRDDVVRPSGESIMNSEIPVFGVVNRARVEELLGQFSGRAALTSYDDLTIRCLPATVATPGRELTCRGELAPGVDAPSDALRLRVSGSMGDCEIGGIGDDGVRDGQCEKIELDGSGPWTVTVNIDSELASFVTRIENILPPPVAGESAAAVLGQTTSTSEATETTEVVEPSVTGDGTTSLPWSVAAAVFAAAFIALGGYLWSRRGRPTHLADDAGAVDDRPEESGGNESDGPGDAS